MRGWCSAARQLQLHHDHVDQTAHRWPSGVNTEVRRFKVQMSTLRVQVAQALQWISHLQQRPIFVMPQPPKQVIWQGVEVHYSGTLMQVHPVVWPQHHPTPC